MTNRLFDLLMSCLFIVIGIFTLISSNPVLQRSNSPSEFGINLTTVKWFIGPVLIITGIWFLFKTLRSKSYKMILFKCPNCGDLRKKDNISTHNCEQCNNKLETLDGFFERHPEYKSNNKSQT